MVLGDPPFAVAALSYPTSAPLPPPQLGFVYLFFSSLSHPFSPTKKSESLLKPMGLRLPYHIIASFVSLLLGILTEGVGGIQVKNLVVFGDSYSDAGNLGSQYTNGPLWHQDLAYVWNATVYDFAVAGSDCVRIIKPSVDEQINVFCQQNLRLDPATTVYALWIGINDVDAITDNELQGYDVSQGITCVSKALTRLSTEFSAKNILVITVPPVQLFPLWSTESTTEAQARQQTILSYNALLNQSIESMNAGQSNPIVVVDSYELYTQILSNYSAYGFSSIQEGGSLCSKQGYCPEADADFFWDYAHLSGAGHRLIANRILSYKPFDAPNSPILNTSSVRATTTTYPSAYANISAVVPTCPTSSYLNNANLLQSSISLRGWPSDWAGSGWVAVVFALAAIWLG